VNRDQALKIAVKALLIRRRQYAPEAKIYEVVKDPALERYWKEWIKLDEAVKVLEGMVIDG
jgi:hypothetical protein